jgi:ankyrin repeat protein
MRSWQLALGATLIAAIGLAACDQSGSGGSNSACSDPPIVSPVLDNFTTSIESYARNGGELNQSNCAGETLVYLATGPRGGHSVLRALLRNGADPDKGTADGRTPLMNAAAQCRAESVQVLLEFKADPNIKDADGKTALDYVCSEPADQRDDIVAALQTAMAASQ